MNYRFKHKYRLSISDPPAINSEPQTVTSDSDNVTVNMTGDFRTVQDNAIVIEDLSITGNVKSDKKDKNTKLQLTIRGLASDTSRKIKKNSVIILEAGFDGEDLPVIFVGQITDYFISKGSTIPEVRLTAVDGYTPSYSTKVSKYYPENTTAQSIIEDLMAVYAANGIPSGRNLTELNNLTGKSVSQPINQISYGTGKVLVGYLDKVFTKFLKSVGFTFYIKNSRLFVEPINYNEGLVENFTLNSYHILSADKKSPPSANTSSPKDQSTQTASFLVKVLLDGRLDIDKFLSFNGYEDLSGNFKIVEVNHDFDYEGNSWFTTLEIQEV